ncbi:MAG: SpvB/TcaC N-terminal domain-containing protein [Candidatus Omnitrophica bacterium]|nr:SpvB/TcaC N-terminal domain-containing protein [Candidatus Omnitrophota bacterium]MDD5592074.1 SpvB/TcaC N-terminal domain-containing protein [Candidatus Omnitrophota bacterium]
MNPLRQRLWLKIVALTISGVFLFSEVTWAARADYHISLPQTEQTSYPQIPQPKLGDFLWNIYQGIASFIVPLAHAEEISSCLNDNPGVMPASYSQSFKPAKQTVNLNNTVFVETPVKPIDATSQSAPAPQTQPQPIKDKLVAGLKGNSIPVYGQVNKDTAIKPQNNQSVRIQPEEQKAVINTYQADLYNHGPPIPNCAVYALSQLLSNVNSAILAKSLALYTQDGQTSLYGIQQVAKEYGLDLYASQLSLTDLKNLNQPAIAHLDLGNGLGHYVVVTGIDVEGITYIDNSITKTVSLAEFTAQWIGYALTTEAGIGQALSVSQTQGIWGSDGETTTLFGAGAANGGITLVRNGNTGVATYADGSTRTITYASPGGAVTSTVDNHPASSGGSLAGTTVTNTYDSNGGYSTTIVNSNGSGTQTTPPAISSTGGQRSVNSNSGGSTATPTITYGDDGSVATTTSHPDGSITKTTVGPDDYRSETKIDANGNITYSNNKGLGYTSTKDVNGDTITRAAYPDGSARAIVKGIQIDLAPGETDKSYKDPATGNTIEINRDPSTGELSVNVVNPPPPPKQPTSGSGGSGGGIPPTPPPPTPNPPTPPAPIPPAITAPVLEAVNDTLLQSTTKINWSAIAGATNYKVEISTDADFKNPKAYESASNSLELSELDTAGNYYARVKVVKTEGESNWSAVMTFKVVQSFSKSPIPTELSDELSEEDYQEPVSADTASPDVPKSSNGLENLGVDLLTGQATFSIPVQTPAGRNGIEPHLALSYSSLKGNGLAGKGWDLDLGSIYRSTKGGVPDYNSSDAFIAQSQELISTGNNEYRAEIEGSFIKYVYDGASWQTTDKQGIKYFFGSTDNSRITTSKGIFSWALDKVMDLEGNYLTISYSKEENTLYPLNISYTANAQTQLAASYKVTFAYEPRPDTSLSYITGEPIKLLKRLKSIEVSFDNNLVRRYGLEYTQSPSTSRSLLTKVTEYGSDGQTAQPPLTFSYRSNSGAWSGDQPQWHIPDGDFIKSEQNQGRGLYDLNGDGLYDFIVSRYDPNESTDRQWLKATYLNSTQGFSSQPNWWPVPLGYFIYNTWDDGRRLVDLTGDGMPELLAAALWDPYLGSGGQYKDAYSFQYLDNIDPQWFKDTSWNLPEGYFVYGNHIDGGIRFADLNGDGLNDLSIAVDEIHWSYRPLDVISRTTTTYINTGSGWQQDARWNSPDGYYVTASGDNGRRLADVNGDGLADFLVAADGYKATYLNTGSGWVRNDAFNLPDGNFTENGVNQGRVLIDINADGLNDLLIAKDGYRATYLNTGSGWRRDDSFNITDGDFVDSQGRDQARYLTDLNGDGLMDICIAKDGYKKTYLNLSGPADLLVEVANGLGAKAKIEYTSSTQYENYYPNKTGKLPFSLQLVSRLTLEDNQGNSYPTTYFYKDGYFEPKEREFRGFSYVKVSDADGNYTESYFKQDNIYKGRLYEQEFKNKDGNLYSKIENVWQHTEIYPGVYFVYLSSADNFTYDGDASYKHARTEFEYDNYGNTTKVIYYGDVDIIEDDKTQTTEYAYNTSDWAIALPKRTSLLYNQQKVSEKRFYYDNTTDINQAPAKGLLTKEEAWLFNPLTSEEKYLATTFTYDSYGNLISTTDALGRTTTTEYDTQTYTYPIKATNVLGQTVKKTFDLKSGLVLTTTDLNNQTTTYVYDSLYRLIKAIGPNDTQDSPGVIYDYDLSNLPYRVTKKVKAENNNYLTSYSFYDGLGRLMQIKSPAEDDPQIQKARQIVSGRVTFDSRGNVREKYNAYYTFEVNDKPDTSDLTALAKFEFDYDPKGRLIKITKPEGTYAQTIYSDWKVTYIDENNHKKEEYFDAYARIVEVKEYNAAEVYTTHYEYNALDSLIKVVDNQKNTSQIFYDSLGRKIKMQDPDMGTWTYEYDAVGNLIKQTDAKGQILTFEYDALNRLTRKQGLIPSQGAVTEALAAYTYDDLTKENSIGRLSKVIDQSGSTEFFYDNLGREIKSVKGLSPQISNSIETKGTVPEQQYLVERTYDVLDRLTSLKYPDGEIISYEYNKAGQLKKVYSQTDSTVFVKNIDYAASGQTLKIEYGNGTTTYYRYLPNTSQISLIVTLNQNNNEVLQELRYTYDNSGNIIKIEDKVKDTTQAFQYDDLDRLIKASGEYGTLNYRYDSIGNLLEKEGIGYQYGARPHAPTQFGNTVISYDANGNLISKGSEQYQYDAENRLTQVNESGIITSFVYDGDGGRVVKTLTTNDQRLTTTYIGSLFEIDSDGTTRKHIFAGSNRVCTLTTNGQRLTTNYYHSDHLGSSSVISDSQGKATQTNSYKPYGGVAKVQGSDTAKYKFNGKELDATGLYFYGARYYDPQVGRFISADTLVARPYNPQELNRYSYCNNNPINAIDPTGHWSWKSFWKSIVGAFVGAVVAVVTAGAGLPWAVAGFWGGMTGGAVTGGLEGGWRGALIGAGIGGALGAFGGWGAYNIGTPFVVGMLATGAFVAGATNSWDSFAGGLVGGIAGTVVGTGINSYFHDPLSIQDPEGGVRNPAVRGKGVGTTPEKALRVANETGSRVIYTQSRGVAADIIRGGMQLLFKNSLASRQLAQYMLGHPGTTYRLHSEMTLTALGAAKMLQGNNIGGHFDLVSAFYSKGTAQSVFSDIGATLHWVPPHLADSAGMFTTFNPLTAPIYGILGALTLEYYHGYKTY